jgi:hypothetical protein
MKSTAAIILLAVLAFSQTTPRLAYAQNLKAAGELLGAINEAHDAYESLTTLQNAAQDALAGRSVSAGSDWANLADRYDRAADAATNAPPPSEFQSSNIPSLADFMDCSTHDDSIEKMRAYLVDIQNARDQGNATLAKLDQSLAEIPPAQQALKYLIDVNQQLVAVPIYGLRFQMDWFDLETRVSRSLNGLEGALKEKRKRFAADLQKLSAKGSDLQSKVGGLASIPCTQGAGLDSVMPGVWTGPIRTVYEDGQIAEGTYTLTITQKTGPSAYAGRVRIEATRTAPPGKTFASTRTRTEHASISFPNVSITVNGSSVIVSGPQGGGTGFTLIGQKLSGGDRGRSQATGAMGTTEISLTKQ